MKKKQKFDLIASLRGYFNITPYMPIIDWVETYITYGDDVSAERDHPDFQQYPYQVEPLKAWEDLTTRKQITVVSCEQMRKNEHLRFGSFMAHGL